MVQKQIRLRRADRCGVCGLDLAVGSTQWWDPEARTVTCTVCHDPHDVSPPVEPPATVTTPPEPPTRVVGEAGASAQRKYDRLSARESARKTKAVAEDAEWRTRIKAERPVLGRLEAAITAKPVVTPESQATRAWATGASGELRVAEILATCDEVHALHDRRVPGSKANIDHIAVSPSGVYVIDAKKYTGQIEARNVGGWLRQDFRLYVNGRDQTKLADAMGYQVDVVRQAMGVQHPGVPVVPVLCFVAATWPGFRPRSFSIRGVAILWPTGLGKFVTRPSEVTAFEPAVVAQTIGRNLRPA